MWWLGCTVLCGWSVLGFWVVVVFVVDVRWVVGCRVVLLGGWMVFFFWVVKLGFIFDRYIIVFFLGVVLVGTMEVEAAMVFVLVGFGVVGMVVRIFTFFWIVWVCFDKVRFCRVFVGLEVEVVGVGEVLEYLD